eukprot:107459_1
MSTKTKTAKSTANRKLKGKKKRKKSSTKKATSIHPQDDEKYEQKSNNIQFKPHLHNSHKKFIELSIGDIQDIYKDGTASSDIFNEIANISPQTMKKYNLESSQVYIE